MKKLVSMFLILTIMLSFSVISFSKIGFVYGDVNESGGLLDDIDAMLLARYLANWSGVVINIELADGNCDGLVDELDDMLMTRYLAGYSKESLGKNCRWDDPFENPNTDTIISMTVENPNILEIGTSMELVCSVNINLDIEVNETPIVTFSFFSSNTAISAHDQLFYAKKMGTSDITITATIYYPAAGLTFMTSTVHTITVVDTLSQKTNIISNGSTNYCINASSVDAEPYNNYLKNILAEKTGVIIPDINEDSFDNKILIGIGSVFGVDSSSCRAGGYKIKMIGSALVVAAKDVAGLDKAVRYLAKYYIDENGTFSVPNNMEIIEAEGAPVKSLTIGGNDISNYVIVKPGNETDSAKFLYANAALQLQTYIEKATGIYVPVISISETSNYLNKKFINLVYDNTSDYALNADGTPKHTYSNLIEVIRTGELKNDGYIIAVKNGNLTIMGSPVRGLLYGVYELIEKFVGFRFIDSDFCPVYENEHIDIPEGTYWKQVEAMEYRSMTSSNYVQNNTETMGIPLRNNGTDVNKSLLNSNYGGGLGNIYDSIHSFLYQFTYRWDGVTPISKDNQPCLSKPDSVDICWESIVAEIDKRTTEMGYIIGEPGLNQISVAWNANEDYCSCSNCRKINSQEGSRSGTLVHFVNEIADRMSVEYPDIRMLTVGYGGSAVRKPTVTPLRSNVILCYFWNGCNNHTFDSNSCTIREPNSSIHDLGYDNITERSYYEGWVSNSNYNYIFYSLQSGYCLSPLPILNNVYYDFNYLARAGCDGIYAETGTGCSFDNLINYLMSKMMWNPYMKKEEYDGLMHEWMNLYYGDGWVYLLEYSDFLEEAGNKVGCFVANHDFPTQILDISWFSSNYEEMSRLFDLAESNANSSEQLYRVQTLRVHMEFLSLCGLYDEYYLNGNSNQKEFYVERYANLYNFVKNNNICISAISNDYLNKNNIQVNDLSNNPLKLWYNLQLN